MRLSETLVGTSALIFCALGMHGCTDRATLEKVSTLQKEIGQTKKDLDTIRGRLSSLEIAQLVAEGNTTVNLDVGARTYHRIETNNGSFLLSVIDAKPYANGHKLILHVGNLQSAIYSGFSLKVKWGRPCCPDNDYAKWQRSLHEKEPSFTSELRPGHWNRIELILSPATLEELGYVNVGMTTNEVKMFN